jgi:hypothetical protein
LELLKKSKSAGIYTLCVYEIASGRITNKTEYDGSFNFRFWDEVDSPQYNYYRSQNDQELNLLKEEVKVLKQKLEEKEDEAEAGIMGQIGQLMENPAIAQALGPIIGVLAAKVVTFIDSIGKPVIVPPAIEQGQGPGEMKKVV